MLRKSSKPGKQKTKAKPIFKSIRKPLAPPGHAMSHAKPEDKARPALRKTKHKRKLDPSDLES